MSETSDGKPKRSTVRAILKARQVAGCVIVTLPKSLRDPLGIDNGDRLMISLDKVNRCLVITKE